MGTTGRTKGLVATVGLALLVAFVAVPALAGAASAAPATSVPPDHMTGRWAYCGPGYSNGTVTVGNGTLTYNATFGWCVTTTETSTGPSSYMLEVDRTVGATIYANFTNPETTIHYFFHAQEIDTGFANMTNDSYVYANGAAVSALGIVNASAFSQSATLQTFSQTYGTHTRSASFQAQGSSHGNVSFTPALGLIPHNLTGISLWNSTAVATAQASWMYSWSWKVQPFIGTASSGLGSHGGNLSATVTVFLTGFVVPVVHPFVDHQIRTGIALVLRGPFVLRDGFVFVPDGFDQFGSTPMEFGSMELGSASMASGETLYLSSGSDGPMVTAADQGFGGDDMAVDSGMHMGPSATTSPSATAQAEPVSVAQAQSESQRLTSYGGAGPASRVAGGGLLLGLIVGAIAVAIGTFGVIEWRSYARRRSAQRQTLVGGYGESWPNGVPPAAALPPTPQGPTGPVQGPEPGQDPYRRL